MLPSHPAPGQAAGRVALLCLLSPSLPLLSAYPPAVLSSSGGASIVRGRALSASGRNGTERRAAMPPQGLTLMEVAYS